MYRYQSKNKGVLNNFSFFDNTLYYQINGDANLYLRKNDIRQKLSLPEKFLSIQCNIDLQQILIILESGKGLLYNKDLKRLPLSLEFNYSCNRPFHDLIIFYRGDFLNETNGIYSIKQEEVLFEKEEIIGRNIFGERLFDESNKTITCRDIRSGEVSWKFLLSSQGTFTRNGEELPMELTKFLGEHNGVMYLLAGNKLILGLDVMSGQEVYKFQYNEDIGGLMNVELDSESNTIFSLGPSHYVDIALDDPTCEVYDISASVKKYQVEGYRLGSWEKNLVYFYEGGSSNRFGVFDRKSKEIIWSNEIEEVKDKPAPILKVKHGGNKLFVYDFLKNLHVFEKEGN